MLSILFVVVLLAVAAEAQQPKKVPQIGFLFVSSLSSNSARIEAFHQGLRDLGYVEGKNIAIEWRSAEGRPDRVPALAAELARLKIELMVTAGPAATRPTKEATVIIPIVMAQDTDPVGNGFVATLARPGGNITALSTLSPELSGKQLELLKEIVPKLSRMAVLGISTRPPKTDYRARDKEPLPAIYDRPEFVEDGGFMTYAVSQNDLYRRAATFVDKILKGAKPGDEVRADHQSESRQADRPDDPAECAGESGQSD
jgi:ABC-type uncharacterized transport system substrate-binding protein